MGINQIHELFRNYDFAGETAIKFTSVLVHTNKQPVWKQNIYENIKSGIAERVPVPDN